MMATMPKDLSKGPVKDRNPDQNSKRASENRPPYANLDNCYGRIGISAVAAAVRCKGEARNKRPPTNGKHAGPYESD
jgi:hypothetical protein